MNSKYQVIAGGRRFRATKAAHLTKVPAIIKTASDKEMRKLALMENILRREMKDYEKAHALKSIYEAHGFDLESAIKHINAIENFRRNGESVLNIPSDILQLCSDIGYSPRTQRRYLKLLSDLKPRVFEYTEKMKLQTEKKEMLARKALRGDAKLQKVLANIIKDIPAREARQIVRSIETGSYIFTGKGFEIAEGKSGGVEDTEPSEFNKRSICNISQDIKPCKRHVESNNWNEKKNIFN
jgi:ParB family chromosome partitioning protein